MLKKYALCFLVSMIPLIELRGGVPIAVGMGLNYFEALAVCIIGNMLPVPFIYLFARKVLEWGCDKKYIGKLKNEAREKGLTYVNLKANDIHKAMGLKSRMPAVCNAMKQSMNPGDCVKHETTSGFSSTYEIQYRV